VANGFSKGRCSRTAEKEVSKDGIQRDGKGQGH
jgi:hypothetical protein